MPSRPLTCSTSTIVPIVHASDSLLWRKAIEITFLSLAVTTGNACKSRFILIISFPLTAPIDDRPGIQQEAICYQSFKQRLILSISEPSISQRSQIKEDTVEPSVPAREFNIKSYTAITWHNDLASPGLEPGLADHRNQAARTRDATDSATKAGCSGWVLSIIISRY